MARVTNPAEGGDVFEGVVQAIFALGPHRPHRY
jgi:hypothetical protein